MQRIPMSLATPGMKLGKAVTNERGMALCGPGTELTQEIINRLSSMAVKRITVEGRPLDTGDPEKSLSEQIEELHARFRKVEGDELMRRIKDIFLKRLKEGTSEE